MAAGFLKRDYGLDPYREYVEEGIPTFRSLQDSKSSKRKIRLPDGACTRVQLGDVQKAYPFSILKKRPGQFEDRLDDRILVIHFDKESNTAYVSDPSGEVLPSTMVYWSRGRISIPRRES